MAEPITPELIVREPIPDELGRAVYFFRNIRLHPQARVLVAVKSHPVQRFVAAAAWWCEGTTGRFKLATLPGAAARAEICGLLISKVSDCCRSLGMDTLQYADLLPDNSEWIEILQQHGLKHTRSERFFEISIRQGVSRVVELFQKYESLIPPGWHTESIRHHSPDTILELIAPYRLMPPEELRDRWRVDCPEGFELEFSSILFDGDRAIGVLLIRRAHEAFCMDVRVVRVESRLLRSLGNALLFYHAATRHGPTGILDKIQFRGGETEHRETANIALRMGGRELPPCRVFAKPL